MLLTSSFSFPIISSNPKGSVLVFIRSIVCGLHESETNIFFDCENSYSSNVNLKMHFNKKISFSDKVNIWLK